MSCASSGDNAGDYIDAQHAESGFVDHTPMNAVHHPTRYQEASPSSRLRDESLSVEVAFTGADGSTGDIGGIVEDESHVFDDLGVVEEESEGEAYFDVGDGASESGSDVGIEGEDKSQMSIELNFDMRSGTTAAQAGFAVWATQNRGWIDLFFKRGTSHAAIDDILALINSPYKSWKTILSRLKKDSGLEDVVIYYPVCPGYMCFSNESLTHCSICGKPRPSVDTKGATKMGSLPLRPRLAAMFADQAKCEKMYDYIRSTEYSSEGLVRDFFDAEAYEQIRTAYGGDGAIENDVFVAVSSDEFQAFRKKSYDVWPICAVIYNRPPDIRLAVKNIIPFGFVPGPQEPVGSQSFLEALVAEVEEANWDGGFGFLFYDGINQRVRIYVVWFTGDLPAVKKVSGVKGHNRKRPCRYCLIQREWCPLRRHMYFLSMLRGANGTRLQRRFDVNALPCRREGQTRATIAQIAALTGQRRSERQIETGITGESILFRLPNLTPYRSFLIDIMHLFYNIGKDFARPWCGREGRPYELGKGSIRQIDEEMAQFGNGVASQLGCRPRLLSRFGDWKSTEVKAFITRYSLWFWMDTSTSCASQAGQSLLSWWTYAGSRS